MKSLISISLALSLLGCSNEAALKGSEKTQSTGTSAAAPTKPSAASPAVTPSTPESGDSTPSSTTIDSKSSVDNKTSKSTPVIPQTTPVIPSKDSTHLFHYLDTDQTICSAFNLDVVPTAKEISSSGFTAGECPKSVTIGGQTGGIMNTCKTIRDESIKGTVTWIVYSVANDFDPETGEPDIIMRPDGEGLLLCDNLIAFSR